MTNSLEQKRREWLDSYFMEVANVWNAWKHNHMSMRERDETLAWYRRKLWELREARRRSSVIPSKPRLRDDDWVGGIEP